MTEFTLHQQLAADSVLISNLGLSQLRLMNRKAVPWLILIPRRTGVKEFHHLAVQDRTALMEEISWASATLEKLYQSDKINVGMLGNIVPQLHVHVVARSTKDAAWPGPVWGKIEATQYSPDDLNTMLKILKSVADAINNSGD